MTDSGAEPLLELNNKVVMVTGACTGLGRELCLDLAKAGCRIIAANPLIERLQSLCNEINNLPGFNEPSRAVAVELDVSTSGPTIEAAVIKAWNAFGSIDALINNAGVRGNMHTPLDLTEDDWNNIVRTNLTGNWLVSEYVCARMRDAKRGGSIIYVTSISTDLNRENLPKALAYATSKSAVNGLIQVMAMELWVDKIRVNSISPGNSKSEITQSLVEKDWLKNVPRRTVPLRTYGSSDPALTSLVRYLIHDCSKHVTGNVYIVEAGAILPGFPIFSSL